MITALSIFFCFLILFSFLDFIEIQKEVKQVLLWFISFALVFFITFRYGVPDYNTYAVDIFQNVSFKNFFVSNSDIHGEIGFLFLNGIIKQLGGSVLVLFFVVAVLSVFLTIKFYKAYTRYYLLALLIYFSHVFLLREMIQIRSGLAIAIVMFSIQYIAERKLGKFLLIVLLASLFHTICLFFIIVYILYPYFFSTRSQITLLLLGLLLGIIFNITVIQKILVFFNVPTIVMDYLEDDKYNFSLGLLNPILFKQLLVLGILYYRREYFQKMLPYFDVLLFTYTIGTFWFATFNSFAILSARVSTMFSNVEHVLIPSLLLINKHKTIIYIGVLIYCIFSFLSKKEMLSTWSFLF